MLFAMWLGTLQAVGQDNGRISVLESNGKMATFSVDVSTVKADDAARDAMHMLFLTLLEQGVEGIDGGRPMMQKNNPKWKDNFLKDKNPPFMLYVKGYQTEGDPLKNTVGLYEATVLVKVNIEFLIRQLQRLGLHS